MQNSFDKYFSALFDHILTFMTDEGGLSGLTVTYWEQKFESHVNIMNSYPVILALVNMLRKNDDAKLKKCVDELVDFILKNQNNDGSYAHSFGDTIDTPAPPIIQIATDIALLEYDGLSENKDIQNALHRNFKYIVNNCTESFTLKNKVVNQNALFLKLCTMLFERDLEDIELSNISELCDHILSFQSNKGGFFHSHNLPDQLSFYNAKIGDGLIFAHKKLRKDNIMNALKRLYEHFLEGIDEDTGLFICGYKAKKTIFDKVKLKSVRKKGQIDTFKHLKYTRTAHPIFIARSAIVYIFLVKYMELFNIEDNDVKEMVRSFFEKYQRPNGSLPNAIGLSDCPKNVWKDISSITRWEAYSLYLASFFADKYTNPNTQSNLEVLTNNYRYNETYNRIIYIHNGYRQEVLKCQI